MEKKKSKTQPKTAAHKKTYEADEVKRYLGALSEEFQGKVAGIGEQFGGLNSRFDEVDAKLDAHTEMIGSIAEDVAIIKTDIELLKSAVAIKVDRQDFAALEKRMRVVVAKLHR